MKSLSSRVSRLVVMYLVVMYLLFQATFCFAQNADVLSRNLQHTETLEAAGLEPVQVVRVGDAQFGLSNPVRLDESHQIAVAWVQIGAERAIRVLYRSNSQCSWRNCDATTSNHIGKGFHEYDKQVPIDVTVALLRSGPDVVTLKPWFESSETNLTQELLAHKLLRLLTVDRDKGIQSGEVLNFAGSYVTREYASSVPCTPVPFSTVRGRLDTAAGGSIADPVQTDLPDLNKLPNIENEVASVEFTIPSYARFVGGNGQLTGRVYLSNDETVKYFFVEDHEHRTMLSGVELLTAPVSLLGVRTRYLDTFGMDTPLMEYGAQIPERFGGRKKYRYQSAWPLVRELPIIAYCYRQALRPLPASDQQESGTKQSD
ncbi:MAG: hypothetical protein WBD31_00295 [Rubripirellula sp.]